MIEVCETMWHPPLLGFPTLDPGVQERIDREYDAYHWMQQMHEASKTYP